MLHGIGTVESPSAASATTPSLLCTVLSGVMLLASASYAGWNYLLILSSHHVLLVCPQFAAYYGIALPGILM